MKLKYSANVLIWYHGVGVCKREFVIREIVPKRNTLDYDSFLKFSPVQLFSRRISSTWSFQHSHWPTVLHSRKSSCMFQLEHTNKHCDLQSPDCPGHMSGDAPALAACAVSRRQDVSHEISIINHSQLQLLLTQFFVGMIWAWHAAKRRFDVPRGLPTMSNMQGKK